MRVHIRRTLLTTPPGPDGRITVAYDVWVPIEECADDGTKRTTIVSGDAGTAWKDLDRYHDFPQATWRSNLEGRERYDEWLRHEKKARRRMLAILHEHCPETRHLDEYPVLSATVEPNTPMERIEIEVSNPLFDPETEGA